MKLRIVLFLIFSSLLIPISFAFPKWERAAAFSSAGKIRTLLPHPLNPRLLMGASEHQIVESEDPARWRTLWTFSGQQQVIHKLVSIPAVPGSLFILTRKSIFKGNLLNDRLTEIFQAKGSRDDHVLSFAVYPQDPSHWFAGTGAGLFESDNAGRSWFPMTLPFTSEILQITFIGSHLFLVTRDRVYRSGNLTDFEVMLDTAHAEFLDLSSDENIDPDEPLSSLQSTPFFHDLISAGGQTLWLGTDRGVLESRDQGSDWKALTTSGLLNLEINHLVHSSTTGKLYAGTRKGIYAFDPAREKWESLFQGLEDQNALDLVIFPGDPPWLMTITPSGISKMPLVLDQVSLDSSWRISEEKASLFQSLLRGEPSPHDLHELIIRYNDLSSSKIKRWHIGSRLRALLPDLSFGRDYSEGNNIDLDRGSSSDADIYISGPNDESRGWDFGVDWDLGDLIYSSSQTSIDNRGKLMVDLRHDMLGEATRIYYERRRLQMETVFTQAPSEQLHFERLIRIDELTSLLDGMTGGQFGKRIDAVYANAPHLQTLWS